jgi:curved DNA-binding protein CbpA
MNFEKAIEILQLDKNFTDKELKKSYYKNAIKHHPDKNNGSKEKEEIFKEINEAYKFLCNKENRDFEEDTSFSFILKRFFDFMVPEMKVDRKDIDNTMNVIINKCKGASITLFEKLSKQRALEIYSFLSKNKELLSIEKELLLHMAEIIKEKVKNDNIIILNVEINDLINDNIYKLEHNEKEYYIPLWSNEVLYEDQSGNDIIIRCIHDLPDNIHIDNDNNIHIKIKHGIQNLLNDRKLNFKIGEKSFEIDAYIIKITKYQILKLENQGILKENLEDIFDDTMRQNIYIHLTLE